MSLLQELLLVVYIGMICLIKSVIPLPIVMSFLILAIINFISVIMGTWIYQTDLPLASVKLRFECTIFLIFVSFSFICLFIFLDALMKWWEVVTL